jgi:uncharacterized membrane protein YhhN
MSFEIISLIVLIFASVGILIADYFEVQVLRFFTKPLLMPALASYYYFCSPAPDILVLIALMLAFIGDVALMWPWKKPLFITGLSAFLLGHLFYVYIFLMSVDFLYGRYYLIFMAIPFMLIGYFIFRKLSNYLGDMKIPVVIYMIVIMLMCFLSFTRVCCFSGQQLFLPLIGSVFFVTSDTILAFYEFKSKFPKGGVYYMSTYILAQLLIVIGLI